MTKRLVEFVESLERDELLEIIALAKAAYNEKAGKIWTVIEDFEDLFLTNILSHLSHVLRSDELFPMRLVSKKWYSYSQRVTHLYGGRQNWWAFHEYLLTNHFTNIHTIKATVDILCDDQFVGAFERIRKLEIVDNGSTEWPGSWDISRWTSLDTLICAYGPLCGLSTLTSLTSLECFADIFPSKEDEIFSLTNLSHINITNFTVLCPISARLPKLCHLESECPSHFLNFTGTGKLDTTAIFYIDDYEGSDREIAQEGFDFYMRNSTRLCLTGKWEDGIFTGDAEIACGWKLEYHGPMVDNKLHGLVKVFDSMKHTYSEEKIWYEMGSVAHVYERKDQDDKTTVGVC